MDALVGFLQDCWGIFWNDIVLWTIREWPRWIFYFLVICVVTLLCARMDRRHGKNW